MIISVTWNPEHHRPPDPVSHPYVSIQYIFISLLYYGEAEEILNCLWLATEMR